MIWLFYAAIFLPIGFALGVAATIGFEWYTWAEDLLPNRRYPSDDIDDC